MKNTFLVASLILVGSSLPGQIVSDFESHNQYSDDTQHINLTGTWMFEQAMCRFSAEKGSGSEFFDGIVYIVQEKNGRLKIYDQKFTADFTGIFLTNPNGKGEQEMGWALCPNSVKSLGFSEVDNFVVSKSHNGHLRLIGQSFIVGGDIPGAKFSGIKFTERCSYVLASESDKIPSSIKVKGCQLG